MAPQTRNTKLSTLNLRSQPPQSCARFIRTAVDDAFKRGEQTREDKYVTWQKGMEEDFKLWQVICPSLNAFWEVTCGW